MKKMILATAATLILAPTFTMAKDGHHDKNNRISYTGPVEVTTVDSLLADTGMFTEKNVVVEGVLLRQVKGDTFIFSDGKGEIQVELDDDIVMAQPVDETTKLRLFGEYEGGNTPEIEVDHIQIL
ncbi:NirD/YgiW/YdeI family stress tolerance protein [Vibrio brasiliensis]|uniref:YgiW/YdeI family stress tolerance OB fold protein n=1 Tax=Vibrio brasiliensis TaxID=170652 RepID=UPI001EFD9BD8|nr:NirD/YgiW/YdeI family stress tolerance protein [Vibrio brasiliensis]MCG9750234.1 NirD/YgiW/YdeI family stress tolerance protein [Vibrio brasiliensis]